MQIVRDEIARNLPRSGEARRLFHGRGHCFPGYNDLVIDALPPVIMVTLYEQRPQAWLDELVQMLDATLQDRPEIIFLQERFLHDEPGRLLRGKLPDNPVAVEAEPLLPLTSWRSP